LYLQGSPMKSDSVVLGIAAVLLLWSIVSLAFEWENLSGPHSPDPVGVTVVLYLVVVGMFQPVYLLPAYFVLRRSGHHRVAKGLLWTMIWVFIPSALLVIGYVLLVSMMPKVG